MRPSTVTPGHRLCFNELVPNSREARIEAGFVVSEDQADPNKKARTEATAREVEPLWQGAIGTPSTKSGPCEDISLAEVRRFLQDRKSVIAHTCSPYDPSQRLLSGRVSGPPRDDTRGRGTLILYGMLYLGS